MPVSFSLMFSLSLLACDPEPQGCAFMLDADGDGFGDLSAERFCLEEEAAEAGGYTAQGGDCDDGDPQVHPNAEEVCGDAVDNDCDGNEDEGPTWYADADGDGHGDLAEPLEACTLPEGYAAEADDCDDSSAEIFPSAPETCDGVDNDCDGLVDDADPDRDPSGGERFFVDADGDGYGDPAVPELSCALADGLVANDLDCDDTQAAISPSSVEICDAVDNDCDGLVDDLDPDRDESTGLTFFLDADGDGYGRADFQALSCLAPDGFVENEADCDDLDAAVSPLALEVCDGVDNDCNGSTDDDDSGLDSSTGSVFFSDVDGDGYGDPDSSSMFCTVPSGYAENDLDCDDADSSISPLGSEVCDAVDNDCDGLVDDADEDVDPSTGTAFYVDSDGDGYGDSGNSTTSCSAPSGYVSDATDCDDARDWIYPGATEVCDGEDSDCDSSTNEDDLVSFYSSAGVWTDYSSSLSTSGSGSTLTLTGGTLNLCSSGSSDTTYYGQLSLTGTEVNALGDGAVTLDAEDAGSVVSVYSSSDTSSVNGLTLTGGYANQGGGLYCSGATLTAENLTVLDNGTTFVTTGAAAVGPSQYNGGGLYTDSCTITLTDSLIEGNNSYVEGGGLYAYLSSVTFNNVEVYDNGSGYGSGTYGGFGIHLEDTSMAMNSGSVVWGNHGGGYGGVWLNDASSLGCYSSAIYANGFDGTNTSKTTGDNGVLLEATSSLLVGTSCDMDGGTGGNWGSDVLQLSTGYAYDYGSAASFTCLSGLCY